jgi:hypothetical protein
VDCGDHRFPVDRANEQITRVGVGLLWATEARERLGRPHLPLLDIGSTGERLPGPAEDRDPSFPITVEIGECLSQRAHQISVEGVSLVRTVQRVRCDVPLPGIADELLAVRHLLPSHLLRWRPSTAPTTAACSCLSSSFAIAAQTMRKLRSLPTEKP